MKLRLKPGHSGFAPNGNAFTDPRTGKKFCGYQLSIEGAIKALIAHRQKNPQHYPSTEPVWTDESNVRQEFYRHLQSRVPEMVIAMDGNVPVPLPIGADRSCSQCSSKNIGEIVCKTCAGHKILGYKCNDCGATLK